MPTKAPNKANRRQPKPKVVAYGNLDKEQEYKITQDVIDAGQYVLLHYKNHTYPDPNNPTKRIDSGDIDSSSKRIGVYKPGIYDEMVRESEGENKENTFNLMHGKYIVLHDPSLDWEEEAGGEDFDSFDNLTNPELKSLLEDHPLTDDEKKASKTANKAQLIELLNKYKTA